MEALDVFAVKMVSSSDETSAWEGGGATPSGALTGTIIGGCVGGDTGCGMFCKGQEKGQTRSRGKPSRRCLLRHGNSRWVPDKGEIADRVSPRRTFFSLCPAL